MLSLLPAARAAALVDGPVTIDLDTTDVEVYGRQKRGVAYNHQGQRVGRPHVAAWAETEIVLAADLGDGTDDPRATAPDLLRRALAALPAAARAGRVATRADAAYFAGQLARAAHDAQISFAISAKPIAPLWRLLAGIAGDDWHDAIHMDNAQVAVAEYCPDWWPASTRPLIRRVALDPEQVSAHPRSLRRRTLHPDQRALPFPELAQAGAIYAYSFILTNLDVSRPDQAVAASTGTGTAPASRTSSAIASSAPPSGTSPRDTPRSTWRGSARRSGAPAAACDRQSGPDCCAAVTYLHTRPQTVVNFPGAPQVPAVTVVHPRTIWPAVSHRHVAARTPTAPRAEATSAVPCTRYAHSCSACRRIICSIAVDPAVLVYCVTRSSDARNAGQRAATACGNSAGAGIMPG